MKLTRKNIVWCVFAVLFFIAVGVAFYSYQNGDFDKYKYHFDDEFRAKVDSFNLTCPLPIGICGYIKNVKLPIAPVEHAD